MLTYAFSGIFISVCILLLKEAFRKPSPKEKLEGKIKPSSGIGSQAWYVGLGIIFFIMAIISLAKAIQPD